jgi:hypothetical protein
VDREAGVVLKCERCMLPQHAPEQDNVVSLGDGDKDLQQREREMANAIGIHAHPQAIAANSNDELASPPEFAHAYFASPKYAECVIECIDHVGSRAAVPE